MTDTQVDVTNEFEYLEDYVSETLDRPNGYISIPHLELERVEQVHGSVSAWLTQLPAVRALADRDLELSSFIPSGRQGTWISCKDDVNDEEDLDAEYLTDADDDGWDSVWRYRSSVDGIYVKCDHGTRGFEITAEGADRAGLWFIKHVLTHPECSEHTAFGHHESDFFTIYDRDALSYGRAQDQHESLQVSEPEYHTSPCVCCCVTCEYYAEDSYASKRSERMDRRRRRLLLGLGRRD